MSLLIRAAVESDLPGVLALYAQPDMDDGRVLSVDAAKSMLAQFARYPNYRLFIATLPCQDGNARVPVLGTYALLIMHNLAHAGTPSAIVEDVVVSAARQGQGIGRQMMQHAQAQARQAGCYKLVLSSNQRRHGAHAFYESLGFERHGISFSMGV